jgi:hypothetical protein
VLYNVADVLAPAVDVAPAIEQAIRHRGVATARRMWLLLEWIEWLPRLALKSRRGFSWLPREERRAWVRAVEASRIPPIRSTFAELREWIEKAARSSA